MKYSLDGTTVMFSDSSSEQNRQFVDVVQIFASWRSAERELATRFLGSMYWQTSKGRHYLYRRVRNSRRSLGRRSPDTEAILAAFIEGKDAQKKRHAHAATRLREMSGVNKALRLARVPLTAAKVLRQLDKLNILGRNVHVVGTNALYAYEAAAAVQFQSDILATGDIDLLFDSRRQLRLFSGDADVSLLLNVLKKVDRSFEVLAGGYSASNGKGYLVDFIAPSIPMTDTRKLSLGGDEGDLVAAEITGLKWIQNAPKMEQVVVGADGLPLMMSVPDPRVYAAYKLWMASLREREAGKRVRDRAQAEALLPIIRERLKGADLTLADLTALPKNIADRLQKELQ